jgi:predicted PurR-regulated permease PerM
VLVVFTAAAVLLAALVLPLWRPLLLAAVVAGPLAGWNDRLARALGERRAVASTLCTVGVLLLVIVPVAAALLLVVQQAIDLIDLLRRTLQERGVVGLFRPLPDEVERWLRDRYRDLLARQRPLLASDGLLARGGWALTAFLGLASSLSHLLLGLAMFTIALFFLLRDGHRLTAWVRESGLVPAEQLDTLLDELGGVAKGVVGGNVLTGAAQATVATVGYVISGAPSPLLLALLTFLASFVPSLGAALVGLPSAALLLVLGHPWKALLLALWTVIPVGLTDNLLRPLLMRGARSVDASLVFFSLLGGALAFGGVGLVLGPLGLVSFMVMTRALRRAGWIR